MIETLNTFCELLKKYRFDKQLSQTELSRELNVAVMTIHRWEKGTSVPNIEQRINIEGYINDQGTFLDPYELLVKELRILSERIEVFTIYLQNFHN